MDERLFNGSEIHYPDYWKDWNEDRLYMHSRLDSYIKEDVHIGDNVYVMVNNSNPEKVLSISPQSKENGDDNISLIFMLAGMVVFLIALFILAKTIIYA